jgi:hypothetical protein
MVSHYPKRAADKTHSAKKTTWGRKADAWRGGVALRR